MTLELDAFVGRQAIFDRRLIVVGYELLFRSSTESVTSARFQEAMLNAFVELGLDALAGRVPVWVNLPADFLLGDYPIPLPPERTVIEVLEVPVTPQLLAQLAGYRARGFRIALADFVLTDDTRPLLELAYCVKVDVEDLSHDELARQYAALKGAGPILLAEKISTHDEHIFLRDLGFYLFQGHFLELPILSPAKRLPDDRAALLTILDKLYAPELNLATLESLIVSEPGLERRFLKLAVFAARFSGPPIGSVRQAVQRLGVHQIAALIVLVMVARFDDKPIELARQALVRARMCELLARQAKLPPDQLFTAGLLSLLDAILDRPLHEILQQLDVAPLIREALEGGASPAGKIIDTARNQNRGDLHKVSGAGFDAQAIFMAWFESVRWADDVISKI